MNSLHETLWAVCRKLPTDFQPYGKRDRDTADPCSDCSCGCRHFVPLEGNLGYDWGICACPGGPRAGLLTFEHQGCPQFEPAETGQNTEEAADPGIETAHELAMEMAAESTASRKVRLNLDEVVFAMEGGFSEQSTSYLDTQTGEIVALIEDAEDYDEMCDTIDNAEPGRFLMIERIESHASFEVMEDFARSASQLRSRDRLLRALSQSKPFRRFKDEVHSDIKLRDEWFAYRDRAYTELARAWLAEHDLEPVWDDPRGQAPTP